MGRSTMNVLDVLCGLFLSLAPGTPRSVPPIWPEEQTAARSETLAEASKTSAAGGAFRDEARWGQLASGRNREGRREVAGNTNTRTAPTGLAYKLDRLEYLNPPPDLATPFPKPPHPAATLLVVDLRRLPADERMLLLTLQGLVNRKQPRIYALLDDEDQRWLNWLKEENWIQGTEVVPNPMSLVTRFRDQFKGVIVVDPKLPATQNVATMLGAVSDAIVATPKLATQLNLPILQDLRGRFNTNVQAYRWAFDNLWPKLNHEVIACLWPDDVSGLRDYLVAEKIFTFWLTGQTDGTKEGADPSAELHLFEQLLAKMPTDIPVMGYPSAGPGIGIGEHAGVGLFAQYGDFVVGSAGSSNLSVHAGFPTQQLRQSRPAFPSLQSDKVYVTWIMSDGDNLPVISRRNYPQLWADPNHGSIPMAWTLSPSADILMPDIAAYYYHSAKPGDEFIGSVSGMGYTYPEQFAQRFQQPVRDGVFDQFLHLTAKYMALSDEHEIWIMGVRRPELISRYAEEMPTLGGIFLNYGRRATNYSDAFYAVGRAVPVFAAATRWQAGDDHEQKVNRLVRQIEAMTPSRRPAFLHAWVFNWAAEMSIFPEVMKRLGPDYVAVRPDQLSALARESFRQEKLLVSAEPTVVAIQREPISFVVRLQDVTSEPISWHASVRSGLSQPKLTPASGAVQAFSSSQFTVEGLPVHHELTLTVTGSFGRRAETINMGSVPTSEIRGNVGAPGSLQFVARYDAAQLPHDGGVARTVAGAVASESWIADSGNARPGHIVFGPYRELPAGKYVALFRLKRLSDGEGPLCRLDAHVEGSTKVLAARDIQPGDAPLGQWRSFALSFTHPGGAIETRVFWEGNESVAVDMITLFRIQGS